jgi:hypothetical protein
MVITLWGAPGDRRSQHRPAGARGSGGRDTGGLALPRAQVRASRLELGAGDVAGDTMVAAAGVVRDRRP